MSTHVWLLALVTHPTGLLGQLLRHPLPLEEVDIADHPVTYQPSETLKIVMNSPDRSNLYELLLLRLALRVLPH
jgi:hypothetical protein